MSRPGAGSAPRYVQDTFDSLGEPLRDITFVVVDLETTGGSPVDSQITEIGAVKVRGGEVLGEFQTLVNPGYEIPPFITVLTGITNAMVVPAPTIDTVLPAFLEFAAGSVLVAHNAPFDLGFLQAACAAHGIRWPGFRKVDTAVLARRVLTRDETPNCKLSTLSRFFRTKVEPCHRALADAQATVDVLHGLLERIGNVGVQTLDELQTFTQQVSEAQRRKRHLADGVPDGPGVYVFRDANDRALYVGTSKHMRARVRQYFVSSEQRSRMAEMIAAADRVEALECAHSLEAEVRELRIIAAHKPPYNRRSKYPERTFWLVLTDEAYPRLSIVRSPRDTDCLGPFSSRRQVESAMTAIHDAVPLRQCTKKLSVRKPSSACALAEIGRCGAPCEHRESVEAYAFHADIFRQAVLDDPGIIVHRLLKRIETLRGALRYEDAAAARDRLAAFLRAVLRTQRLRAITAVPELVAARPDGNGGWEISLVRHGRLAAAGVAGRGAPPWPVVDMLRATAETVLPGIGPTPSASGEETERILAWLLLSDVKVVAIDGTWAMPSHAAERWRGLLDRVDSASDSADPFADRRGLRPLHRPARASA
ncbi:DEDD exonuclease domain-containing protein [Fodinicola feengrottensis]|uniref:DEDD exonuclease domain-containing protein n=1 Tax=Fodinicola feengrottensis TaxID=435914 RepID=A0ABN2IFL1_9ACTN